MGGLIGSIVPYFSAIKYGAIALAVLAAITYVGVLKHKVNILTNENTTLQGEIGQVTEINKQNAIDMAKKDADYALELKALRVVRDAAVARAVVTGRMDAAIKNAKPGDDGPIAPSLCAVLSQLPGATACRSPNGVLPPGH